MPFELVQARASARLARFVTARAAARRAAGALLARAHRARPTRESARLDA